jgi:hypothetical protein
VEVLRETSSLEKTDVIDDTWREAMGFDMAGNNDWDIDFGVRVLEGRRGEILR